MTETVSRTNNPPIIASTISCLTIIATAANEPPKDRDPVSPIKIFAGGALYHRKPKQDPTIAPQKTAVSPTPEYIVFADIQRKLYSQPHNL